ESVAAECGAGVVQLHGDEPPGYCASLRRRVIKAIRVRDEASLASLTQYRVDAFLLDTFVEGALGGTGRPFPWELAQQVRGAGRIILSGGLTPETVGEAIRRVRPYGVDVSSGVEAGPGRKDPKRLQEFIRRAREAG
ncbi:MAG: N-(5'-phosphoribosyl)anthranilate isomerase, partial [Candidatus Methylomirabilales bacterium]